MENRRDFIKKVTTGTAALAFGGAGLGLSAKSYGQVSGANDKAAFDYIRSGKFGDIVIAEMCWNVNQPGRWRLPYPRNVVSNGGIYQWRDGRSNADTLTSAHVRNWMECVRKKNVATNCPVEAGHSHAVGWQTPLSVLVCASHTTRSSGKYWQVVKYSNIKHTRI
jgi:hypothetical protein